VTPTSTPSASPTVIPTMSPTMQPTTAPSRCLEVSTDEFFFKMKNNNKPVYKTCEWLGKKNDEKILDICTKKTDSHEGKDPAKVVCKCTCDIHSPPSSAPSSKPNTKSPTNVPVTSSPTKLIPTSVPTRSDCCSQDFKTCSTNVGSWCHNNEQNCLTCGGSFISDAPRKCIARWDSCNANPSGCCSPATCERVEGQYKQCQ